MMGIPNRQPPYQPLGDLNIEFSGHDNATDYRRELNLATGIVRVTYRIGDAARRSAACAHSSGFT